MQWPWMEAVCVDVSQNLAPLDTCHVMFLDVATTMLSKLMFFLSVFILLHTFFFVNMCSCTPCIGADQSQLPTNLVVCCPHILYLRTFQRNKHRSQTAAAIDSMRVAPQKKKKKLATKDMYISRSVWLKKVFECTHNFLGPSKRANKHWTNIHTQVHNTVPASVHEVC